MIEKEREKTLSAEYFIQKALTDSNKPILLAYRETNPIHVIRCVIYYLTPAGMPYMANMEGRTSEAIRDSINKGVKAIWESSSVELKRMYPFEALDIGKKKDFKFFNFNLIDHQHFGLVVSIANLLAQGKNPSEIAEILDVDESVIYSRKPTLKKWGMKLPFKDKNINKRKTIQRIEHEENFEKLQEILNIIDLATYRFGLRKEHPIFIVISNIDAASPFRTRHIREAYEYLSDAGIPVGNVSFYYTDKYGARRKANYYYILTKHLDLSKKVLLTHPKVMKLP